MSQHGHFYWNELMTHDVEKAKKFYATTIGWTFDSMATPNGTYWLAKMGDTPVGGMFPMAGPNFSSMPEQWVSYVAVDDVDARVEKATRAGAKIMQKPFDVPDVGRIAIMREPGGAMVAWITPVDM